MLEKNVYVYILVCVQKEQEEINYWLVKYAKTQEKAVVTSVAHIFINFCSLVLSKLSKHI